MAYVDRLRAVLLVAFAAAVAAALFLSPAARADYISQPSSSSVDDTTSIRQYDDFCTDLSGAKQQLPWTVGGQSIPNSNATETAQHPCIVQFTTGAAIGNFAGIANQGTGNAMAFYSLGSTMPFSSYTSRWIFMIDHGANSGTSPFAVSADAIGGWAGFITATQGSPNIPQVVPNAGIGLSWNSAAPSSPSCSAASGSVAYNTADLMLVATNASGATTFCYDTSVPAQANVWYDLAFSGSPTGGFTACINGANCTTIPAAQLPTATMKAFLVGITNANAAKNVWIDYFSFIGNGLTR